MNRILLCIFCFILFTNTNHAQYTSIINANTPGDTETPYAVGRRVFQVENTLFYNNNNNQNINSKASSFSNDINLQYGFWSERLQATLKHRFTSSDVTLNGASNQILGTEDLSIGLKYLLYHHVNKESPELKKSWKRRYGFKYNGLIPSIGIAAYVNTPLSNTDFNKNTTTGSVSLIAQNNINKKLSINNQFDLKYIGEAYQEFIYSISSSYVVARRFNPYFQFRYHHLTDFDFFNVGVGTPFLVNKDLAIGIHYNAAIGNKISGHEVGLNLAFRIDRHYDRWEYIDEPKEEKAPKAKKEKEIIEEDEFIDTLLEEAPKEKESKKTVKEEKPKKEKKAKKKKKKKKKKKEPLEDVILSY
ncbi:hypothetical protein AXE80_02765 [Wenyingzhuangia fucanilytica]|uniref:Transporter n=1 Tax=Wenyingzhuangia fucanilytica TaxID=1790137 RepID=A0A1B1Y3A9_9FLAO|nr:transporter [Wenyingzhuangia fucanilytica]ANW95272.1 hypothetical protein AXE80_02765 [Wenyingzhuangia fucanilytica]